MRKSSCCHCFCCKGNKVSLHIILDQQQCPKRQNFEGRITNSIEKGRNYLFVYHWNKEPISLTDKAIKTLLLISKYFGSKQICKRNYKRVKGINSIFTRLKESSRVVRTEHSKVATGTGNYFL